MQMHFHLCVFAFLPLVSLQSSQQEVSQALAEKIAAGKLQVLEQQQQQEEEESVADLLVSRLGGYLGVWSGVCSPPIASFFSCCYSC